MPHLRPAHGLDSRYDVSSLSEVSLRHLSEFRWGDGFFVLGTANYAGGGGRPRPNDVWDETDDQGRVLRKGRQRTRAISTVFEFSNTVSIVADLLHEVSPRLAQHVTSMERQLLRHDVVRQLGDRAAAGCVTLVDTVLTTCSIAAHRYGYWAVNGRKRPLPDLHYGLFDLAADHGQQLFLKHVVYSNLLAQQRPAPRRAPSMPVVMSADAAHEVPRTADGTPKCAAFLVGRCKGKTFPRGFAHVRLTATEARDYEPCLRRRRPQDSRASGADEDRE